MSASANAFLRGNREFINLSGSISRMVSRMPVSKAAFCPALNLMEMAPVASLVSLPLPMFSNLEIRFQLIFLLASGFPSGSL